MYSTYENKILKRLKYIIAVLLLITILPGNAGVKNNGQLSDSEIDSLLFENIYSSIKSNTHFTSEARMEYPGNVSDEENKIKSDPVNIYKHQAREISPNGKSFNFFLVVK
jgi:hypothetical protein